MALTRQKLDPDKYDRELAEQGLKRIQVIEGFCVSDTGKRNDDGEPVYRGASVYREKLIPVTAPKRQKDDLDRAISSKKKSTTTASRG